MKEIKRIKDELLKKWNSLSKKRKQLITAALVTGSLAGLCCIAFIPNGNNSNSDNHERVEEKENSKTEDKKLSTKVENQDDDEMDPDDTLSNPGNEMNNSSDQKDASDKVPGKEQNTNNTGNGSTDPAPVKPEEPSKPSHTHSWKEVTQTVHHDAVTHIEKVLKHEAWDEPVYETVYKDICNDCGADITGNANGHLLATEHGSFTGGVPYSYQTGVIHHGAIYDDVEVVDKAAYDEIVVTGYKCSCGAVK